jgi:cilia- and flagella-associated protein 57
LNAKLADQIREYEKVKLEYKEAARGKHQIMWEDTWQQIGDRTDRNKSELALRIEDGLKDKGELTRKQKEMRDLQTKKE